MKKHFLIPCFAALLLWGCNHGISSKTQTTGILAILQEQDIDTSSFELFIRAFKAEKTLEVWAKNKNATTFQQVQEYNFCTSSGVLGPKRQEGDLQIPEGCYWIDRFNPNSNFHLSLGLNYPNDSDRILGHPQQPGSDIFIHGGCASVGCIPITNPKIEELYALAATASTLGQQKIPVHIFPSFKMLDICQKKTKNQTFWQQLLPIFTYFETNKQLPKVWIKPNGDYAIAN